MLLPELFERVLAPQTVHDELAHHEAPAMVHAWIAHAPAWLDVQPDHAAGASDDRTVLTLDFERLKATSFYSRQGLLDALLASHGKTDE